MDYEMGKVKGIAVMKELRARGCMSPIIIRSANDDFDSMNEYLQAGATGSLSKDTRMSELVAAIQLVNSVGPGAAKVALEAAKANSKCAYSVMLQL